jgi:MFS family permease
MVLERYFDWSCVRYILLASPHLTSSPVPFPPLIVTFIPTANSFKKGPFIGGIIVTFRSWRDIFWLQTALAGTATLLVFFFLPETIHYRRSDELQGKSGREKARTMWQWLNPLRILRLYRYPNLLTVVRIPKF